MSCDDARAQFSAFLDGEADASDALEAHLSGCEVCREEARRAAAVDRLSLELAVENRRMSSSSGLLRISRRARTRTRKAVLLGAAGAVAATALVAASVSFYLYATRPLPEAPMGVLPPAPEPVDGPAEPVRPPAPAVVEKAAPAAPAAVEPPAPARLVPSEPLQGPAPRAVPAPAPVPAPRPEVRPAAPTVVAAATLERGVGEVYRVTAEGRTPAKAGEPLFKGQTLHTEGFRSGAVVAYANGSSVELRGGTNLEVGENAVFLSEGAIQVRVAEAPMAFSTPHARATGKGASLTLQVCDEASMLRVDEGGVRWTRRADGASQEIAAGSPPAWALSPQERNPAAAHPHVDQKRVDEAIKKGIAYLKAGDGDGGRAMELMVWTYLHAGLSAEESHVKVPLDKMLSGKLARTYNVALQAMILEKLDRVKHQTRIFHCAQFLTDNQWESGQWGYGKETNLPDPPRGVPSADRAKVASAARKSGALNLDQKVVTLRLPVTKQALDLSSRGDNSNTQYALLGMRACHDAGILFPAETIARADKWWRENQAAAAKKAGERPAVASGSNAYPPAGWGYAASGAAGGAYGSMTVGGLGGLCIIDYIQGKDWKRDPDVLEGVNWIASNFSVTENPGRKGAHHLYYLYGLERAGVLFGTDFFGPHDWYMLGANYLIDSQKPDGSWSGGGKEGGAVVDTCFAILFLKRATKPLQDVASVERK